MAAWKLLCCPFVCHDLDLYWSPSEVEQLQLKEKIMFHPNSKCRDLQMTFAQASPPSNCEIAKTDRCRLIIMPESPTKNCCERWTKKTAYGQTVKRISMALYTAVPTFPISLTLSSPSALIKSSLSKLLLLCHMSLVWPNGTPVK